jgi:hypothetical protein
MNTIRKFILAVVATAVATSFLPTSSFAKKTHKAKEQSCSVGKVCMNKPDKAGWGTVMRCTYDGKMIGDFSPCNVRSGMCPKAIKLLTRGECPLWVKSRHRIRSASCPLYPQKRTSLSAIGMSAVPKTEVTCLLDHLVSGHLQLQRHLDAERLRCLQVDDEFEFG